MSDIKKDKEYFSWIGELKNRYRVTQIKAAVSVNSALLEFYWNLGKDISEKYPGRKRNAHFFAELSADLKLAIPDGNGLSSRNLQHIQKFYEFYSYAKQAVSHKENQTISYKKQIMLNKKNSNYLTRFVKNIDVDNFGRMLFRIPWGHHIVIMSKCCGNVDKALFYVQKTIENGWSRNILTLEMEADLYSRQGKAVTNFALTLPKIDSDLAQQLTKDPYIFDVQGLAEQYRETELTKAMCDNIVKLLSSMAKVLLSLDASTLWNWEKMNFV
jgi:predicted nuclease of restriction endonuclease-like (RecB) superfamily